MYPNEFILKNLYGMFRTFLYIDISQVLLVLLKKIIETKAQLALYKAW